MPDSEYSTSHFERRTITTRSPGFAPKVRDIYVPDEEARVWHANILQFLYTHNFLDTSHLPSNVWVNGAMPGAQLLDGVLPHKDNWSFYKLDIKNAFPSVSMPVFRDRLFTRADELGVSHIDQRYLSYFMDEYGTALQVPGLPLGGPASSALFNIYCREMDRSLAMLSLLIYSRRKTTGEIAGK